MDARAVRAVLFAAVSWGMLVAVAALSRVGGVGFDDSMVTLSRLTKIVWLFVMALLLSGPMPSFKRMRLFGLVCAGTYGMLYLLRLFGVSAIWFSGMIGTSSVLAIVSGVSEATLIALSATLLASLAPRYSCAAAALAYLMLNVLMFVASLVPMRVLPFFKVGSLIGGTVLVFVGAASLARNPYASEQSRLWFFGRESSALPALRRNSGLPGVWQLIGFTVSVAVFLFLYGFVAQVISIGGVDTGIYNSLYQVAVILVSLMMAVVAIVRGISLDNDKAVLLVSPMFSLAFVFLVAFGDSNLWAAGLLAKLGYAIVQTLFWIVAVRLSYAQFDRTFLYVALFYGMMELFGLIGRGVADSLASYAPGFQTEALVAVMAICAVLGCCLLLLASRRKREAEEMAEREWLASGSDSRVDQDESPCDKTEAFAQHYGLSARECQILSEVTKGYTMANIGDLIGLSPSTVRTYIRRIYVKVGCESKQELVRVYDVFGEAERDMVE